MESSMVPSSKSVLQALCRSITATKKLRVEGQQEGYRCKATYSLLPALQVSPLSMPIVNAVATAVDVFCTSRSRLRAVVPDFFFEVCVKVNRTGQYMIKLSLLNRMLCDLSKMSSSLPTAGEEVGRSAVQSLWLNNADESSTQLLAEATLFDVWRRSPEPSELEDFLRSQYPTLVSIVAHVRLPPPAVAVDSGDCGEPEKGVKKEKTLVVPLHRKPDKSSAYVPLTRDGATAIVEYTPNGYPFGLSADSFCEVNHHMEDEIYKTIVTFLRLGNTHLPSTAELCERRDEKVRRSEKDTMHAQVCSPASKDIDAKDNNESATLTKHSSNKHRSSRRAFICGRDVNSVVRTFEEYYDATTVATTCPCVYADTQKNNIPHCLLRSKDQLGDPLQAFALTEDEVQKPILCNSDVQDTGEPESVEGVVDREERHVLITAGRHGLHPTTTTTLAKLGAAARLTDLIYVSCNVESLTRDVHVLKESWFIAHARTFDFFPGTDYVMTVLHLRPLLASTSCASGGDLLVLPVGLPGVGKSTCGRALSTFFASSASAPDSGAHPCSSSSSVARAPQPATKKAKQEKTAASCFVPRTFLSLEQQAVDFRYVERDQVFHDARGGSSLKVAKQQTHETLLKALDVWGDGRLFQNEERSRSVREPVARRRVLYLDSTNGSREARALYAATWSASSLRMHRTRSMDCNADSDAPLASCVVLHFAAPQEFSELLRRVQQRGPHPSFPASVEDQQRKLDVIAAALKSNGSAESAPTDKLTGGDVDQVSAAEDQLDLCTASCCIRSSDTCNAVVNTVAEVVVTVYAHLLFSSELAALLRDDAIHILREHVA